MSASLNASPKFKLSGLLGVTIALTCLPATIKLWDWLLSYGTEHKILKQEKVHQ